MKPDTASYHELLIVDYEATCTHSHEHDYNLTAVMLYDERWKSV